MTVVGVAGHSNLTDEAITPVRDALLDHLRPYGSDLIGMTCIARGADQVFADAVLDLGGVLDVVLPAADYLSGIPDRGDRERCDAYIATARSTVTLPYGTSGPSAYLAASRYLIDHCDVLMAVWDGRPPTGSGGTAEAVSYAREQHRDVVVVWPDGAQRKQQGPKDADRIGLRAHGLREAAGRLTGHAAGLDTLDETTPPDEVSHEARFSAVAEEWMTGSTRS